MGWLGHAVGVTKQACACQPWLMCKFTGKTFSEDKHTHTPHFWEQDCLCAKVWVVQNILHCWQKGKEMPDWHQAFYLLMESDSTVSLSLFLSLSDSWNKSWNIEESLCRKKKITDNLLSMWPNSGITDYIHNLQITDTVLYKHGSLALFYLT